MTTQTKHTPGPWRFIEYTDADGERVPGFVASDASVVGSLICEPPNFDAPQSRENWPANARLIAAAPDLLEALRQIEAVPPAPFSLDRLEHATRTIEAMREIARAAIAKAGA